MSLEATPDLRVSTSRLLTIAVPVSKLSYLIDTGAEISVLPPCPGDGRNASGGIQLLAANGSSIRTFGERSVQLDLGLAKSFTWKFTIAEVTHHHIVSAMALSHRTYPSFISAISSRLGLSPKCVQLVMMWFRSHVAAPHIQFLLSR